VLVDPLDFTTEAIFAKAADEPVRSSPTLDFTTEATFAKAR